MNSELRPRVARTKGPYALAKWYLHNTAHDLPRRAILTLIISHYHKQMLLPLYTHANSVQVQHANDLFHFIPQSTPRRSDFE